MRQYQRILLTFCALSLLSIVASVGTTRAVAEQSKKVSKPKSGPLVLATRTRVLVEKDSKRFHVLEKTVKWEPGQTAIIVCDMWDKHWCLGATRRVGELAPRMNQVLTAARERSVLIIHAPSGTMGAYQNTPQRRLAQSTPKASNLPKSIGSWCNALPDRDKSYPIDQTDGGCDCSPQCKQYGAWKDQVASLKIHDGDVISDNGVEIWNVMEDRKIKNVIIMGVHTNMCILGRPFGIRNMARFGKNVVLMRDMTDTMYNSKMPPFVNHFTGNDLIFEHIEKNWCPTITSDAFLGGKSFRFSRDKRPHIVFIIAEDEYETAQTLPEFAKKFLGKDFKTTFVFGSQSQRNNLPGLEVLRDADLAFISVRRRVLPTAQLKIIRDYLDAGKPLVAIRTASHALSPLNGKKTPAGHAAWVEFDSEVLGGNYHGHHSNGRNGKPKTLAKVIPSSAKHPILKGVPIEEFVLGGTLYKVSPLAKSATPLVMGRIQGIAESEPVAWTHTYKGGRVFYTSLGHPEDFKLPTFQRMLVNAIHWTLDKKASHQHTLPVRK